MPEYLCALDAPHDPWRKVTAGNSFAAAEEYVEHYAACEDQDDAERTVYVRAPDEPERAAQAYVVSAEWSVQYDANRSSEEPVLQPLCRYKGEVVRLVGNAGKFAGELAVIAWPFSDRREEVARKELAFLGIWYDRIAALPEKWPAGEPALPELDAEGKGSESCPVCPEDPALPNACCEHAGEYNGFGSDGPRLFTCPDGCAFHD